MNRVARDSRKQVRPAPLADRVAYRPGIDLSAVRGGRLRYILAFLARLDTNHQTLLRVAAIELCELEIYIRAARPRGAAW